MKLLIVRMINVAPIVGAWIEIDVDDIYNALLNRRSYRGSVD